MTHPHINKIVLVLAVAAFAVGCGKKAEKSAATPPAADASAAVQPAAAPAAAQPTVVVTDVNQALAEADAALKAKAYEKAVATLLAVQRQNQNTLTAQQAEAVANKMRSLQAAVVSALSTGDPHAQAAAQMLRQSHR